VIDPVVIDGNLLDQDVDVIVNAWNRNIIPWWLLIPQGVSGAIKKRAGLRPFRELRKAGPMPLGSAFLTSAGRLPHKAIIHVAGINMLWRASPSSIRLSVLSALRLAEQNGFRSIAFPLIGAGSGGMNADGARDIVLTAIRDSQTPLATRVVRFGSQRT
jgi:O-acetyl-ADP-ribose deacetylase (regulator of RNase III)